MKKYMYSSDIGSFAIVVNDSVIRYSNGYGDGGFNIFIIDSYQEWLEVSKNKKLSCMGVCDFNGAYLVNSDILNIKAFKLKSHEYVLDILRGQYLLFNSQGDIYLIKLNEYK